MQIKTIMRYQLTPSRMTTLNKQKVNVGEGLMKLEPLWTMDVKCFGHCGKQSEVL